MRFVVPQVPLAKHAGRVARLLERCGQGKPFERQLLHVVDRPQRARLCQSKRSMPPTVYTPVRGPYCPDISAARVGWQFGPQV